MSRPYRHRVADRCHRASDGTHVRDPGLPLERHGCIECLTPATTARELWAPDGAPAVVVWVCARHLRALIEGEP